MSPGHRTVAAVPFDIVRPPLVNLEWFIECIEAKEMGL